jgi:predicted MFS family arabinose efflux permease
LGVALVAALGQISRRGLFLLVAVVFFGLGQVLLGQSVNFWMALTFVTLVNVMAAITDVLHQGLLQLSVSNEQRGRAMGSWIVGIGTAPVGQLQIGYLAEVTSSRVALLVNGVGLAALAVIMGVLMPRLRRL